MLDSCAFAGGPFVQAFEKQFGQFCGCGYCIGVGSGTEVFWLALLVLGVGQGDEVITVPNTFIATAEAISFCGSVPVFIDIDEKTYTMDPQKLEDYLQTLNLEPAEGHNSRTYFRPDGGHGSHHGHCPQTRAAGCGTQR